MLHCATLCVTCREEAAHLQRFTLEETRLTAVGARDKYQLINVPRDRHKPITVPRDRHKPITVLHKKQLPITVLVINNNQSPCLVIDTILLNHHLPKYRNTKTQFQDVEQVGYFITRVGDVHCVAYAVVEVI